jgi:alkylated DNA repair protein alkB family protein 8
LFQEGELEQLISKVEGLRLVQSYYDQGNWCIVAEKL